MSTYLDTEMIKRLRNKTINELKRENEKQRVIIKKLKICINECLAIAFHANPDTYNNSEALRRCVQEQLKALKAIEDMEK